ncbi:MAG TPA: S9 family peptidase, partial [Polyangiaceae bacterium]|nr:S9 family peptidase [Polyangiaceae bacterium]
MADPYRWLEEDTDEVKAWVQAQNERTEEFLAGVPERTALRARLAELFEIGTISLPTVVRLESGGVRYFFTRRGGTEDQPRLFVQDGPHGTERVLFDPNREATTGPVSLDWYYPSLDGRLLAYGTSRDGSEDSALRVRDVATGADVEDRIPRTRHASVAWAKDGDRFYYTRYPSDAPK